MTLSFVPSLDPQIGSVRLRAGDDVREHVGLLPDRIDEAVELSSMLDAFSKREDFGIACPHLIVTDDGAIYGEARQHRDLRYRPNAGADDDHVGFQRGSVLEFQVGDAAIRAGQSLS